MAVLSPNRLSLFEIDAQAAFRIVTVCSFAEPRCISILLVCGLNRAMCLNWRSNKSASSSRLMRERRFKLKAAVTPKGSS